MQQFIKRKYNKVNTKGVTLVEVLLYVSVVSIILIAMSAFNGAIIQSRIKNTTVLEVEQQGMLAMQTIAQSIRSAEAINSPSAGTDDSSLSIDLPDDGAPTVFSVSDDSLWVERGGSVAVRLTNNRVIVDELLFENLTQDSVSDTVRIMLTLNHRNPAGRNEYSFEKTHKTSATVRQP